MEKINRRKVSNALRVSTRLISSFTRVRSLSISSLVDTGRGFTIVSKEYPELNDKFKDELISAMESWKSSLTYLKDSGRIGNLGIYKEDLPICSVNYLDGVSNLGMLKVPMINNLSAVNINRKTIEFSYYQDSVGYKSGSDKLKLQKNLYISNK